MKYVILLDYDGTLTPIVKTPELAKLSPKRRKFLKALSKFRHITVCIVSGRALLDVKDKVKVKGIHYIGNHGFEMERPSKKYIHPQARKFMPLAKKLVAKLNSALKSLPGILVENKIYSISIHYRLARAQTAKSAQKITQRILSPYLKSKSIKVTHGKKVIEIRPPVNWHKGKAVLWILKELNLKNYLPIYIGDDKTDEDAFKVLNKKGMSIRVGKRIKTAALHTLPNVTAVYKFLHLLQNMIDFSPNHAKMFLNKNLKDLK